MKKLMVLAFALAACGGQTKSGGGSTDSDYAPLEFGADYASYTRLNKEAFMSPTHGKRFVDVYVNDIGRDAYKSDDAAIPVGTVIVKTSWETKDGKATDVPGPIFVMKKTEGDWWYALHWADVPESWQPVMKAKQVYWRDPSPKAAYCRECHGNFPRELGGIPAESQAF